MLIWRTKTKASNPEDKRGMGIKPPGQVEMSPALSLSCCIESRLLQQEEVSFQEVKAPKATTLRLTLSLKYSTSLAKVTFLLFGGQLAVVSSM